MEIKDLWLEVFYYFRNCLFLKIYATSDQQLSNARYQVSF